MPLKIIFFLLSNNPGNMLSCLHVTKKNSLGRDPDDPEILKARRHEDFPIYKTTELMLAP